MANKHLKTSLIQTFKQTLITLVVCGILIAGISIIFAWVGPTQNPPNGNVPAPINVGGVTQYKKGALGVGGVFHAFSSAFFDGNVGIGTTKPSQKLDVNGYVKGRSGLCIGNDCRNKWPEWAGSSINLKLFGPYEIKSSGTLTLGRADFCFLTKVYVDSDIGGEENHLGCRVQKSNNGIWILWAKYVKPSDNYSSSRGNTCGAMCATLSQSAVASCTYNGDNYLEGATRVEYTSWQYPSKCMGQWECPAGKICTATAYRKATRYKITYTCTSNGEWKETNKTQQTKPVYCCTACEVISPF